VSFGGAIIAVGNAAAQYDAVCPDHHLLMLPRIILLIFLQLAVALVGCGSRPLGPLDARLYGKWEARRGFVGTDTLDFRSDGTLEVTSDDGQKKKKYTSHWYVKDAGKEQIKLSMQAQGKEEFRVRSVKFRGKASFEMSEGNKILGRFEKKT
jgi:hypothetical protein